MWNKRLYASLSNSLENTGNTDTGLLFGNTISSPDLYLGTLTCYLQFTWKDASHKESITYMYKGNGYGIFYMFNHAWL